MVRGDPGNVWDGGQPSGEDSWLWLPSGETDVGDG